MSERRWTAADFDYPLPEQLIAQIPLPARDGSRLLVVAADGTIRDSIFTDVTALIPPGDVVVVNSTRVRHARLHATRRSGRPAEVLLIHPAGDDSWIAMGNPGRAMMPGKKLTLGEGVAIETIEVLSDGTRRVRFIGATADAAIIRFGKIPLPPYIVREPTAEDSHRYQTVYADRDGSVAAPTAGLHFTPELLAALRQRGVTIAALDLEVGPGTFRPMDAGEVTAHPMHAEQFTIPEATADAITAGRARGARVWAIGTTVVRALESAARDDGTVTAGGAETRLMIAPGFRFRVADRLITNFHLPRSTLLMLVAAFVGYDTVMAAYQHAIAAEYRFYSYGDAMCLTGHPA
ncbi:MAG TPA: tRNA preQ1(34) S-adenosylmethionine ribosyltransferase-isomerase QueA [Gemmatimonadales bacterium]|jgi:S-adenosylmethionine:tRNA ribosyltransferase-isomerase